MVTLEGEKVLMGGWAEGIIARIVRWVARPSFGSNYARACAILGNPNSGGV
jgi:hypothetical protein